MVHRGITGSALELGRTETARGRKDEAIPLLREALALRVKAFGDSSWKTAETRLALASAGGEAERIARRVEAAAARR